jgi:prepilin-type N-terminal cleavage/methylation domain-containing protein
MIAPSVSSRRAFTLIELLVVISIIAILLTLLFPAAGAAMEAVKRTQAKNDATQIATAINAYISEYGRVPAGVTDGDNANTTGLMDTLNGKDDGNNSNPRQIVFLETPKAKSNKYNGRADDGQGTYKDSWGTDYEIRVDANYDNKVTGPDGDEITKTVIVWSNGNPDKLKNGHPNYVKSWE